MTMTPDHPTPSCGPASPADLAAIRRLLECEKLPSSDITEQALQHFLVARDANGIVGAIGIETLGAVALLRSLVVAKEQRGRGLGATLTAAALALAKSAGCQSVYLLTTTAETFFKTFGFRVIERDHAPDAIRTTTQFSALCPSTAVVMMKPTTERALNVLILCTGNSARSILAEVAMNRWGAGNLRAFSAGSHPKGQVHPLALELLEKLELPIEGLRSKSWDEFTRPDAPQFDFIITVCDNAAGEACPIWPGRPMTVHWGIEDPAAVEGSDERKRAAFLNAFRELEERIKAFASLPVTSLDKGRLKQLMDEIGRSAHA